MVANPNFIIGGMATGACKEMLYSPRLSHPVHDNCGIVDEEMIAKGREVEEWLMGSGGSFTAATTGGSESMQGRSKEDLCGSGSGAAASKAEEEEGEEEQQKTLEEWMYKTVVRSRQSKCAAALEEEEEKEEEEEGFEGEIEEFLQQEELGFQNLNQYMDLMDSLLDEQGVSKGGDIF